MTKIFYLDIPVMSRQSFKLHSGYVLFLNKIMKIRYIRGVTIKN